MQIQPQNRAILGINPHFLSFKGNEAIIKTVEKCVVSPEITEPVPLTGKALRAYVKEKLAAAKESKSLGVFASGVKDAIAEFKSGKKDFSK